MNNLDNPRALALHSLVRCEKDGKFANLEVNAALKGANLSDPDRGLYTALVYGVAERALTLDCILAALSDRPVNTLDAETKNAIRMGLYQLRYMDKIPAHAAVSESVEAVARKSRGFVNAILRSYLRKKDSLVYPKKEEGFDRYLSVKQAVPEAICRLWREGYGEDVAEALAEAANWHTPLTLRVNTLKTEAEALRATLEARGVTTEIHPVFSDILTVTEGGAISRLADLIEEGIFFVQDPASRAAVAALGALPGEKILDTCAAPGGKSFSIAIQMENRGELVSCDLHKSKISLIESGARRLGISILRAECRDGRELVASDENAYDRVLCDVPCSGLGVLAKKPDIRHRAMDGTEALCRTQRAILDTASHYVKAGGTLCYSTCTLNPMENEEAVREFLSCHSEFEATDFTLGPIRSKNGMYTFFPGPISTDGFFVALMKRK